MLHRLFHGFMMRVGYRLVPARWLSQIAERIEERCTTECASR